VKGEKDKGKEIRRKKRQDEANQTETKKEVFK
jgi:hypothetical protein